MDENISETNTVRIRKGEVGAGDLATFPQVKEKVAFVKRLYACDRVVKFNDQAQLHFGNISIHRKTKEVRIEWDDGKDEYLPAFGAGGVALTSRIGILDRSSVGFGSKVTSGCGTRSGQVREKRFLVTLALENDPNSVLVDIPMEDLIRSGYSMKGDKVIFKDKWLGVTVNTRARVHFKMDKDGKLGNVANDHYGFVFPHPGDKMKMDISHLWDAKWLAHESWLWNFLKYLGNKSTVVDTEIDCLVIAWMGHVDYGTKQGVPFPPNDLRTEKDIDDTHHLYGRNWAYVREYETYAYKIKKNDSFIQYHQWVRDVNQNMMFSGIINEDCIYISPDDQPHNNEDKLKFDENTLLYVKVVAWRSVLDIEWDDGQLETLPSYEVKPYTMIGIDDDKEFVRFNISAGNLVRDKNEPLDSSKYGIVVKSFDQYVCVTWIWPDTGGHMPKLSEMIPCLHSEIDVHPEYRYLRCLHHLPVVVPKNKNKKGERLPVDDIKVGVAVGVNIAESKIIVKCPDELERLVWAHDFEHFDADVLYDKGTGKWVPWCKFEHREVDNVGWDQPLGTGLQLLQLQTSPL